VTGAFRVGYVVRPEEVDTQGHLNEAEYLRYSERARWACLLAAGLTTDRLLAEGLGPVQLTVTMRFLRELRAGDQVEISSAFHWGAGRTYRIVQGYTAADGTPVADLNGVAGLLDLGSRTLVTDPRARLLALVRDPGPLGLAGGADDGSV
jgi:acyl-CoA thioester hydrolase